MVELARGHVTERPWGRIFAALSLRAVTGQLTLVSDAKRFVVVFERGAVVAAASPLASDAAVRVALTSHLVSSSQVPEISRRQAAAPHRDEIDLIAELARLGPDHALRLRRRAIAVRAARTFSINHGEFVVTDDSELPILAGCELDARAVIYIGARINLSEQRLATELEQLGTWFRLKPDVDDDLPQFGFTDLEQPVIERLRDGGTVAELEAFATSFVDARTVRAVVYALAVYNACDVEPVRHRGASPTTGPLSRIAAPPAPPPTTGSLPRLTPPNPVLAQAVSRTVTQPFPPVTSPAPPPGLSRPPRPTPSTPHRTMPMPMAVPGGGARPLPSGGGPVTPGGRTTQPTTRVAAAPPPTRPAAVLASGSSELRSIEDRAGAPSRSVVDPAPESPESPEPPVPRTTRVTPGMRFSPAQARQRRETLPAGLHGPGAAGARPDEPSPGSRRPAGEPPSSEEPGRLDRAAEPGAQDPATGVTRAAEDLGLGLGRESSAADEPGVRRPAVAVAGLPDPASHAGFAESPARRTGEAVGFSEPPAAATPRGSDAARQRGGSTPGQRGVVAAGVWSESGRAPGADVVPRPAAARPDIEALIAQRLALLDRGADHFALLGVTQDASQEILRKAYFGLARQLHPDRLAALGIPDDARHAQRLFAQVNAGFAVLSDPRRRAQYVELLRRGGEAGIRADQVRAEELARRIVDAEEAFRRGELALRRDQPQAAVAELERALQLNPDEADYHALLAWSQFCAAADKMAVASTTRMLLERAIQRAPRAVTARFYLGRVERMLGRDQDALRRFREVLAAAPGHAEAASELRVLEARLAGGDRSGGGTFGRSKR